MSEKTKLEVTLSRFQEAVDRLEAMVNWRAEHGADGAQGAGQDFEVLHQDKTRIEAELQFYKRQADMFDAQNREIEGRIDGAIAAVRESLSLSMVEKV